jgi:hypothetical protein
VRRLTGAVGGWFQGPDSGRKRTAVIAVVCVLCFALFWFTRGGDGDGVQEEGFSYSCPAPSVTIEGIEGEQAELIGCLDGSSDPASADRGPQIAQFAVERGEDGVVRYTPDAEVTRGEVVHGSMRLYTFAGGPAPSSSTPVDLSSLPADQVQSVQAGVSLGIVPAAGLDAGGVSTRQFGAVVLYRALSRAGVVADARGQAVPSDAPSNDPEAGRAVVALRQAGIIDGSVEEPFGFSDPLVVADWVLWAGRSAHEIRDPGSGVRRIGAAVVPTTSPERRSVPVEPAPGEPASGASSSTGPGPDRVSEVISSLTSGDVALIDQVVVGAGAGQSGLLNAAMWAGLDDLGLQVRPQAPASVRGNEAAQIFEVASADNKVQTRFQVVWVLGDDGVWRLAGWPSE